MSSRIELLHFYVSPDHNYFGHHGRPAGESPIIEMSSLQCVAGRGVQGDRFFDHRDNYKGQITFFACEVYDDLCHRLAVSDKSPAVFRRNVVTRGIDLNTLIDQEFTIQGVKFFGVESCKPCYWMDRAFAPGAEAAMEGRGGLRAKILTTGVLTVTAPGFSRLQSQVAHDNESRRNAA